MESSNMNLHDSILKKIIINSTNHVVTLELDVVTRVVETNSPKIYQSIKQKAIASFTNYQNAKFNLISDIKNEETILDFNLIKEPNSINIYIYTSNDSTFEFYCESYEFMLLDEERIEDSIIVIP